MYNLSNLKSRLTRAQTSNDPVKIVKECERALALFDAYGYPDCWHRWNIAHSDALWKLARLS